MAMEQHGKSLTAGREAEQAEWADRETTPVPGALMGKDPVRIQTRAARELEQRKTV